jgi:hypothetical protein
VLRHRALPTKHAEPLLSAGERVFAYRYLADFTEPFPGVVAVKCYTASAMAFALASKIARIARKCSAAPARCPSGCRTGCVSRAPQIGQRLIATGGHIEHVHDEDSGLNLIQVCRSD